MEIGIYGIFNQINGRVYIGQTVDFAVREKNHFTMLRGNRHPNNHLQRSFNKYGEANLRFVVICRCEISELVELEQAWLDYYPPAMKYNQADSAVNAMLGRTHTPETRAVISRKLKGKKHFGRVLPPESIEKMRRAKLGKKMSAAARRNMNIAFKGRKHSPAAIEKMRLAKLGKPRSAETRAKISAAKKGRAKTPEAKQRMREAAQRRWTDPEYRKRMIESRRARAAIGKN